MKIRTHSVAETRAVAAALAEALRGGDLVVLAGDLGGGKTAFVQGACAALGVRETVTSPTFAIVQEYVGRVGVVHVDVYRLDTMQELHDLGFDELIDGDRVTFVEWGNRIRPALPAEYITVEIGLPPGNDIGEDDRIIVIAAHGPNWGARARKIATALAHHLHPEGSTADPDAPAPADSA
jgi:tRNA threonylcarbamoyladenosine biosynthesis protein TsaE